LRQWTGRRLAHRPWGGRQRLADSIERDLMTTLGFFLSILHTNAGARDYRVSAALKVCIGAALSLAISISLLSLSLQRACAQEAPKDKTPPRFQHAFYLIDQRRCQEAWDEFWRLAQTRDYYALYLLTGSELGHPFVFTGASAIDMEKIYRPMEIYATLTPEAISWPIFSIERLRRSWIPSTLGRSRDLDRSASKAVIDCFESTAPPEVCVRLAIERRVIPDYDAYIATVNLMNKTSLHVGCEAPPDPVMLIQRNR